MNSLAPVTRTNKRTALSTCYTAAVLLHLCFISLAYPQTSDSLFNQAEKAAANFNHDQALELYTRAYQTDTTNCTTLWKIAEIHVNLGEEAGEVRQRQHYYVAEKWARRALQQCPEEPNAHFFVAVTSGLLALYEGGKSKIRRSRIVKREAEKTLELDPDHHGAYHVLGRWHRELANLSWLLKTAAEIIYGGVPTGASNEAAVENFKRAIEISPEWIEHHKELGLTYMEMEKWRQARAAFERVLTLPVQDHMDHGHKKLARNYLKQLEDR